MENINTNGLLLSFVCSHVSFECIIVCIVALLIKHIIHTNDRPFAKSM